MMREIITERRELPKHYYDLKERLDCLDQKDAGLTGNGEVTLSTLEREKITQQDYLFGNKQATRGIRLIEYPNTYVPF